MDEVDQKVLLQRLILVVASLLLAYATFYGHKITRARIHVLETGQKIHTVISRMSSKRTLQTVYVNIDGMERDAGDPIGECAKGDSIIVYYQHDVMYVVPVGRENFISMLIFQSFCFAAAVALFALALLYPKRRIIEYTERKNR